MTHKKRTREDILADLQQAKDTLLDVQTRGNEAISKYDLMMGYDADFYLNKCPLLKNHVSYFEKELKEYNQKNPQLYLF